MKKIFVLFSTYFLFASTHSQAQTSVTAGPEQKIKAVMRIPEAVKPGSAFTVKIEITKGSISGLGRFQQYLPAGMTATALETSGADFMFENQYAKFIWVNLPQDEMLTIRYSVATDASLNTSKTLSGTFSYVENGRTKSYSIIPKEIRMDAHAQAEEMIAAQPENKTDEHNGEAPPRIDEPAIVSDAAPSKAPAEEGAQKAPAPSETKSESEKVIAEEKTVPPEKAEENKPAELHVEKISIPENTAVNKTPSPPPTSPPAPAASGIIFRVQIAAMNEKHFRRDGHFQKAFNLEETVYKEVHEGLKKYTVGSCSTYKAARSLRTNIISHVDGAFIVAYSVGVRIPVGDALLMMKKN
jgi:hypothetical protein